MTPEERASVKTIESIFNPRIVTNTLRTVAPILEGEMSSMTKTTDPRVVALSQVAALVTMSASSLFLVTREDPALRELLKNVLMDMFEKLAAEGPAKLSEAGKRQG